MSRDDRAPNFPTDSERIVIAGRTGSGKTTEALWHLSQRSIGEKPWIVLDFKGDDLVSRIPVTGLASIADPVPRDPGVYVVKADVADADKHGRVEKYLLDILAAGNTGLLVDEGYIVGQQNRGLRALLTQGRSKQCPIIFLTQRPAYIDTFALSESEYLQIFAMQHPDDHDRIARFVPPDRLDMATLRALGPHHSFLYDVRSDTLDVLEPCPPFDTIYDRILKRLPRYEDAPDDPLPRRARV